MSTSLAQQLQKLAAPQTAGTLADAHSRASILFDPKEAATKDRRAIYEIGLSGLQQLTEFNPAFKEFQLTLYDEATLTLERAVELAEVNKMLNAAIAKFLRLLSPYILLRPAHMAFEWLLRRFQVHEYNRDDIMALILPYHETKIFVQILQTMRLRQTDNNWAWLRPLQRPGVTLAKSAIINRAATNPAFLSFICKSTRKAVKELGSRAHQLQTQINFFATVVVGALETAKPVQDWHISTILEPLLKGLSSETVDFMAASYVIVAQLVSRTKLKSKVCNALLERIANCPFERQHTTSLLLLIWIHDKQQSAKPEFKPETISNLVCQKWLITCLVSLAKENIAIQPICIPLIRGSVCAIKEKDGDSATAFKQFLDNLISEVPFSKASAQQLINCFLDTYVEIDVPTVPQNLRSNEDNDNDTIVIDSDDEEMPQEKTNFQAWYLNFLEKLERRFPEAFDLSVKEALRSTIKTSNREKALKLALGFRLNTNDEKAKLAYEKLYHHSPDWRLKAVKQLLRNLKVPSKRERSLQLLQECLIDRLQDDNGDIVSVLLGLDTTDLIGMLKSAETFARILCSLLQRAQDETADWKAVIHKAVQHLTTSDVSNHYDTNLVLLAMMPFLFPTEQLTEEHHRALVILLESEFVLKRVRFLSQLKVPRVYTDFHWTSHCQQFLNVIASSSGESVNLEKGLLASVEQNGGAAYLKKASQFTHLLLLLTASAKRPLKAKESLQMLQKVNQYSQGFRFKWSANHKTPHVKLQLFLDFLLTLAKNTRWQSSSLASQSWTEQTNDLKLCLLLIEILAGQVYAERRVSDQNELKEWINALMQCLNCILPKPQQKLDFLSNFFVYERLPEVWTKDSDYAIVRLQGFRLLQAVVRGRDSSLNCSLIHVLRVANACASSLKTLRLLALDSLKLMKHLQLEDHVKHLVEELLQRKSELSIDQDQYALILFTILVPRKCSETSGKDKLSVSKLRRSYIDLVTDATQPPVFTIALLSALKHVNDGQLLTSLLPLGLSALEKISSGNSSHSQLKHLSWPHSEIYRLVLERFEGSIALNVLLRKPLAWDLFEKSFQNHDSYIQLEHKLQPIPCLLLNTLTPDTYEKLQSKHKVELIKLIVDAATKSDNDSIFLAGHRLFKRCNVECQPLVAMLVEMAAKGQRQAGVKATTPAAKRRLAGLSQLDLTSSDWKRGMTLLELLEHKKQLIGAELLIPPLFELLQACLSLEEHSAAEYPKQLILSCLLHCCQTAQAAGVQLVKALPESCFRIEQVVQCLRNTQNPQTQQHALLFLTHCAGLYPQQVLHKIVEIFTFVGSSVARHDDAFNLHIIHNVVESVVPILLTTAGQKEQLVIPVLKVFSDICTDVPVHRRLPLYATLFKVLKPKEHLWQFLCIVFESQVLLEEKTSADKSRLEFTRELTLMFSDPLVILETFIQLLDYLTKLPVHVSKSTSTASTNGNTSYLLTEHHLFDVRTRSFKQLRHYKYLIMDYLSSISCCQEFQSKMNDFKNTSQLFPYYQEFILKTLAYVTVINDALIGASGTPSLEKYWRVLANHAHDVLDNAIGLLSPQYFINVITELLQHDLVYVRIKVLELLVRKFDATSSYFEVCDVLHFGVLFGPLEGIVNGILESTGSSNPQQAQLQQASLQALQLLAHRYGRNYIEECRSLLATLTRITKRRSNVPKAVVGNVVLTLAEICACLKAHALAQLPKFAPQLVELLKTHVQQIITLKQGPDYLCSTLVTAFHTLFKALPLFLGPYLVDIISALVRLSVQLENPELERDKRAQAVKLRLNDVWTALVQGVAVRILVPSCAKSYTSLLEAQAYAELGHLMQHLLLQCIKTNTNAQLQAVQDTLSELFLHALEFRLQTRGRSLPRLQLSEIEGHIGETFVTWILKLSESSFRPMYSRLHKWAVEKNERETRLTYFLLTQRIAEALKSLFVLFASEFLEDSCKLVHEHNSLRTQFDIDQVEDDVDLLDAIFNTLHHVFIHCNEDFINDHRFNALMQPLVDQLENDVVLQSERLQQSLSNSLAQLAVATNDVMWKHLNTQVLLKTRTQTPEVRILAFNSCVAIARKLGDSFAPLLPETVPFIAELLEDEHERVEKSTRSAVQELEGILGEPVQKYL